MLATSYLGVITSDAGCLLFVLFGVVGVLKMGRNTKNFNLNSVSCHLLRMLRGAEEACWAHNPKVLGSKPSGAKF